MMDRQQLEAVLFEAQQQKKYVWIKHCYDPVPQRGEFALRDDGTLLITVCTCFDDDREGLGIIGCQSVQWAHVSDQVVESKLREVFSDAIDSRQLVQLVFSDYMAPRLFLCQRLSTEPRVSGWGTESVVFGNFVLDSSESVDGSEMNVGLLSDEATSCVRLSCLLNVQSSHFAAQDCVPSAEFDRVFETEPHLEYFRVKR